MRRSRSVFCCCALWLVALASFVSGHPAYAQGPMATTDNPGSTTGSITGTIVDPTGALIPGATINAEQSGNVVASATTDSEGHYTIPALTPGCYTLDATAVGFQEMHADSVCVAAGAAQRKSLTLPIEVQKQQAVVNDSELDTNPANNGSAIVLKGAALDALSSDPTELQQELTAMAGPNPQGGNAQFYVDGFSSGKLPPKSSIREIRINQNPYFSQYDQMGWGRVDIFTKPGSEKLTGGLYIQGNDSSFNTSNPFIADQPPYYSYMLDGNVSGPVNKWSAYRGEVFHQHAVNDSVVDAVVLDSNLNQVAYRLAAISPTNTLSFNPEYDFQAGKVQTIKLRYGYNRTTATNSGVSQFALPSQAIDTENTEQSLEFIDTQIYGTHVINQTNFQYVRDRNNQTPTNNTPTITVQGGFTGGGNNTGINRDNQDHYEFQDYLDVEHGKHEFYAGFRLRDVRDANVSTANFNGNYTFASIAAYQITEQGLAAGKSAAEIRAEGGGASLFSQTVGAPGIAVNLFDAGVYLEESWKPTKDFSMNLGVRYETQTDISDHADFAPRLQFGWSIPGGKNKPPRAVIRAGYGMFYTRFASTNVLQARRQNGVEQVGYSVTDPDFFPETCGTTPAICSSASASSPTIFSINPYLRAPYTSIVDLGIDKPLGKHAGISANFLDIQGTHDFLTRNINAPLPGTYNPDDPTSGVRPLGTNENIYQYESEGASERKIFFLNGHVQVKKVMLFAAYALGKAEANTAGISSFPSNSYDLHVDYGRASDDVRQRAFLFSNLTLPGKVSLSPMLIYSSSAPFNITTGTDLNGDTEFNDRPAFATDLTRSSVYKTKWGNFDADPIAGQKIIPINYGKGPDQLEADLRLSRGFQFGPKVKSDGPPPPPPAKDAKPGAKPVKPEIERKYKLSFGARASNFVNKVNLAPPVGVLDSPLFGTSTALNSGFGGSSGSANRTVVLFTDFNF
ncbi:carboxypeptidase regulatory-like domain-containing protein [Silvibacterium sp.]|uniref:TonB-dependent receptor n=1 Tax=Silvibacterium sp. TaxID=1964179 RepID=UPI0039E69758